MKRDLVLYLGSKGFPYGMAAIQRQIQITKAIASNGIDVLVINRKGAHSKQIIERENIKTRGSFEGIDYIYTSGSPYSSPNFFVRNFMKVVGLFGEFFMVAYLSLTRNVVAAIAGTSSLPKLKYFWFLTRLFRIKFVYDYVEYMSSLSDRALIAPGKKRSFDTVFYRYADSMIIISEFLRQHVVSLDKDMPILIIPPMIDFEKFDAIDFVPPGKDYFLFCGSLQYIDVVEFIIGAYKKVRTDSTALVLILNGEKSKLAAVQKIMGDDSTIKILSDLPYESLIGYYKNSMALLIPLKDNLQDKARFPFKICEYTAAGKPIITSDSGAIVNYFTDGKDAVIARTDDADDFSAKMNFILENKELAKQIGFNGHNLGLKYFNYRSYAKPLKDFILGNLKGPNAEP